MCTASSTYRGRVLDPGFSLVELLVVLLIGAVVLSIAAVTFSGYLDRTAAERAAQVFARDLTLARSSALRGREEVTVSFDETSRRYTLTTEGGRQLVRRRFDSDGDIRLSAIDLEISGDSVVFSSRGVADLDGLGSELAAASFTAGGTVYEVVFNAMGASRVTER